MAPSKDDNDKLTLRSGRKYDKVVKTKKSIDKTACRTAQKQRQGIIRFNHRGAHGQNGRYSLGLGIAEFTSQAELDLFERFARHREMATLALLTEDLYQVRRRFVQWRNENLPEGARKFTLPDKVSNTPAHILAQPLPEPTTVTTSEESAEE